MATTYEITDLTTYSQMVMKESGTAQKFWNFPKTISIKVANGFLFIYLGELLIVPRIPRVYISIPSSISDEDLFNQIGFMTNGGGGVGPVDQYIASGALTEGDPTELQFQYNTGTGPIVDLTALLEAAIAGNIRKAAVKSILTANSYPLGPTVGDRYIINNVPPLAAPWVPFGVTFNDLVEWNGTAWIPETPSEGWTAYVDALNLDALFVDDGTPAWELRSPQNLAATLLVGNTTGGRDIVMSVVGDYIESITGQSRIDMNWDNEDNAILISTDRDDQQESYLELNGASGLFRLKCAEFLLFGSDGVGLFQSSAAPGDPIGATSIGRLGIYVGPVSGILSGPSQTNQMHAIITDLSTGDVISYVGQNGFLNLNSGSSNLADRTKILVGIDNSLALGGIGLTVKTGNTAYANQISFQQPTILFDLIVKSGTVTADRVQTLQDKSGTIALTSDLSTVFLSSGQTITSAGSLTIAHGLTVEPDIIQVYLQCTTAERGYSIGDKVQINSMSGNANSATADNKGIAFVFDATNLVIRFGADTNVFRILDKSTGMAENLINGNWQLYVKAIKI
jgi:hypothetical protein